MRLRNYHCLPKRINTSRQLRGRLLRAAALAACVGLATPAIAPALQYTLPDPGRVPMGNRPMGAADRRANTERLKRLSADRQKQLTRDGERLLVLVSDLKAEVDSESSDTMSATEAKKADQIEKLAHGIQEKMTMSF
jgi:hypothetical protein